MWNSVYLMLGEKTRVFLYPSVPFEPRDEADPWLALTVLADFDPFACSPSFKYGALPQPSPSLCPRMQVLGGLNPVTKCVFCVFCHICVSMEALVRSSAVQTSPPKLVFFSSSSFL